MLSSKVFTLYRVHKIASVVERGWDAWAPLTSEYTSTATSCRPFSAERFAAWYLMRAETRVPSSSEEWAWASVCVDVDVGCDVDVQRKKYKKTQSVFLPELVSRRIPWNAEFYPCDTAPASEERVPVRRVGR
jgi:hypothetical protein